MKNNKIINLKFLNSNSFWRSNQKVHQADRGKRIHSLEHCWFLESSQKANGWFKTIGYETTYDSCIIGVYRAAFQFVRYNLPTTTIKYDRGPHRSTRNDQGKYTSPGKTELGSQKLNQISHHKLIFFFNFILKIDKNFLITFCIAKPKKMGYPHAI